jgi:hypothetical protein
MAAVRRTLAPLKVVSGFLWKFFERSASLIKIIFKEIEKNRGATV